MRRHCTERRKIPIYNILYVHKAAAFPPRAGAARRNFFSVESNKDVLAPLLVSM
jgi:hypothetical protein